LTTLATRKQSQNIPQHIAPETPLQHVYDFFFGAEGHVFLYIFCIFLSKKKRKTQKKQL
jgi:hypothetical protein